MRTAARWILGCLVASGLAGGTRVQAQPFVFGGGDVVADAEVVVVYWGAQRTGLSSLLDSFYSQLGPSGYFNVLSEYSLPSRPIGQIRWVGSVFVNPGGSGPVDTITIARQIDQDVMAGRLPYPNAHTIYMVHFGPAMSVVMGTNIAGIPIGAPAGQGYCAYHFTAQVTVPIFPPLFAFGPKLRIGVVPDPGVCAGPAGVPDNATFFGSHELVEAITNPDSVVVQMLPVAGETLQCNGVPIPPQVIPPADLWAWASPAGSQLCNPWEVADPCAGSPALLSLGGQAFTVSTVWRAALNGCGLAPPPGPSCRVMSATVTPYPVPVGVPVSVRVDVVDGTGSPVPGARITIDGKDMGPAGSSFTYTFRYRRVGRPPNIDLVAPVGQAVATGFCPTDVDFGL